MTHELYKISNPSKERIPFKLLYITKSKYGKDWHSTKHTHHFTELFYIVKGKGAFVLSDREIPVKENDLVIINPNIEHTEKSSEKDSLEYIAFGLEGIFFSIPEERQKKNIGIFTYQGNRSNVLFYLNKLVEEAKKEEIYYEFICHNLIELLIYKLRREKNISIENKKSERLNHSVALVKHYINQNFRKPITLDELAEIAHINKFYLAHIFKKEVNISPIGYLNKVRIKEAQNLLETTDLNIGEIAFLNGFSSQSYFTQSFKRETGLTPSEYRNAKLTELKNRSH